MVDFTTEPDPDADTVKIGFSIEGERDPDHAYFELEQEHVDWIREHKPPEQSMDEAIKETIVTGVRAAEQDKAEAIERLEKESSTENEQR
jgi:hypothetical protein